MDEIIKLWKEKGIARAVCEFSCGGDSMNETVYRLYDKNDNEVEGEDVQEIKDFFENEIYNEVEFYVNSDGHYLGEFGTVDITLNEDEENVNGPYFEYSKNSRSEWSETVVNVVDVELTQPMIDFINANVDSIVGGMDDEQINYKRDFIMSEEDELLVQELQELINDVAGDYEPELDNDEDTLDEWYTYTTSDGNVLPSLTIDGNILKVAVRNSITTIKDE